MALPFAHAPVFQAQRELGLAARLHQIAEVVAVAGIAEEGVVGVAHLRAVGLHLVVGLRLLLTRLHLIHGAGFQCLTLLLLTGKLVEIALVALLREGQPVHHVAGVVQLEEGLEFGVELALTPKRCIHHLSAEGEVERLACDGVQLIGDVVDVVVDQDGSLIDG